MSNVYGVNPQGFILKRLADILSDYQTALAGVSDPVTGESLTPNLTDERDPLIQFINSTAAQDAQAWEQLQMLYNLLDPQSSTGAGFSGLVQLNGITRFAGTYSTVVLNLTGTPNYTMPSGAQAGTQDGTMVFNLPQVTFDSGGNAIGIIGTCTVLGPGANAEGPGTVTQMVTPASGWGSVTNPEAVVMGVAQETDEQLRARQQVSTSNTAGTIIEAWYSALIQVAGVTFARVYQNVTSSPDGRGIPGNSIAPVVVGGVAADIANCIYSKISVSQTYGNQTVNITDKLGTVYEISYSIPTPIPIFIALTVNIINSALFPDNGAELIADAIISFVTGGMAALGIDSAYEQVGYVPGQPVYASDLYAAIMTVPGIQLVSLALGIGAISTVAVDVGGSGYAVGDVVAINQAGASGGLATVATEALGVAETLTLTAPGMGFTAATGLSTTMQPGTGLEVNITASGSISAAVPHAGAAGTGYAVGDLVSVAGGTGGKLAVATISTGGVVLTLTVNAGGSGYTTAIAIATTPILGTGLTVNVTQVAPALQSVAILWNQIASFSAENISVTT